MIGLAGCGKLESGDTASTADKTVQATTYGYGGHTTTVEKPVEAATTAEETRTAQPTTTTTAAETATATTRSQPSNPGGGDTTGESERVVRHGYGYSNYGGL
jgi:DNA transposition AAA+ family ATPase